MDLQEIKDYALSNQDIQQILQPDTNILTYPDLSTMTTIDECFDGLGRCILLYLTESPTSGHWVSMIKHDDDGTIEYFDPYGKPVEEPLHWVGRGKNMLLRQQPGILKRLLKDSGYKVIYNTTPYQKDGKDISTCGRHCVSRLVLKDYSIDDYKDIIKSSKLSPDDFVSLFTYGLLGK